MLNRAILTRYFDLKVVIFVLSKNNYRKASYGRKKRRGSGKPVIALAVFVLAFILAGIAYFQLPFLKVGRAIAAGDKLAEEADYQAAIESYAKALQIDSGSVTAYNNMAGAYLGIGDVESAKSTLYDGWTTTGDESLLTEYHSVILSEASKEVDGHTADMNTASDLLSILRDDNSNSEAVALLDLAYQNIFDDSYAYNADAFLRSDACTYSSENGSAVFSYDQYEAFLKDMLEIYSATQNERLKEVILKYAVPGLNSFTISYEDGLSYNLLLDEIEKKAGSDEGIDSIRECLTDAAKVQEIFADIFEQLDVGNVDELRDFVVSDEYIELRDVFLHEEYSPQENTTYIPISREAMVLNNKDGKWSYRFLDFEENPQTNGVITLWANFFEDNGVQRNSISYEPASINGDFYPHTKYSVTYLYSYTTSGSSTKVAKMNYRLDTTIETSDGEIEETVVGDWGGPDEWTMDIDTIESRIKA